MCDFQQQKDTMNIRRKLLLTATFCGVFSLLFGQKVYNVTDFGLIPDTERNASPLIQRILNKMQSECIEGEPVTLKFASGRYSFREDGATIREYYISNHDQTNPKRVGLSFENWKNLTVDGQVR